MSGWKDERKATVYWSPPPRAPTLPSSVNSSTPISTTLFMFYAFIWNKSPTRCYPAHMCDTQEDNTKDLFHTAWAMFSRSWLVCIRKLYGGGLVLQKVISSIKLFKWFVEFIFLFDIITWSLCNFFVDLTRNAYFNWNKKSHFQRWSHDALLHWQCRKPLIQC